MTALENGPRGRRWGPRPRPWRCIARRARGSAGLSRTWCVQWCTLRKSRCPHRVAGRLWSGRVAAAPTKRLRTTRMMAVWQASRGSEESASATSRCRLSQTIVQQLQPPHCRHPHCAARAHNGGLLQRELGRPILPQDKKTMPKGRTGLAVAHDDGLRADVFQPRESYHVRQRPQRRRLHALLNKHCVRVADVEYRERSQVAALKLHRRVMSAGAGDDPPLGAGLATDCSGGHMRLRNARRVASPRCSKTVSPGPGQGCVRVGAGTGAVQPAGSRAGCRRRAGSPRCRPA